VAPELVEELLETLLAAAVETELEVVEEGSAVLVELAGVIAAAVSWRMAGAMVEVGVGVDVEVEVGVGVLVELVEEGQAAATALSSHSNLCSARPLQASSTLMASGDPDLEGSITTKSYTTGPGTDTVSVSAARLWW
jgi:hypothetical protein